jgi:hypothetical protein
LGGFFFGGGQGSSFFGCFDESDEESFVTEVFLFFVMVDFQLPYRTPDANGNWLNHGWGWDEKIVLDCKK